MYQAGLYIFLVENGKLLAHYPAGRIYSPVLLERGAVLNLIGDRHARTQDKDVIY